MLTSPLRISFYLDIDDDGNSGNTHDCLLVPCSIYESTRSSARTSDKILPRNMCIKRTTGEHSSRGILHIDRPNPPLIGRKDEKLANAASYVKVIVKQGLGRLKTLRCTEHVRGATHTSMALVWADSAAPRLVTLNNGSRWVPSGATQHSKRPFCIPCYLSLRAIC